MLRRLSLQRSQRHSNISSHYLLQRTGSTNPLSAAYITVSCGRANGVQLNNSLYEASGLHSNHTTLRYLSNSTSEDDKKKTELPLLAGIPKLGVVSRPKMSISKISASIVRGVKSGAASVVHMIKNPAATWKAIKDEAHHYWIGSKLFVAEIRTASEIIGRLRLGHDMTRREREHLKRTASDVFRLVPFSIFVIVPFMELLLPFALKLFPNMLPSTFQVCISAAATVLLLASLIALTKQDELKKEEDMKKELQMRLAVAGFLHETLESMAQRRSKQEQEKSGEVKTGAKVVGFLEKLRVGETLANKEVVEIASLFKDELMLPNMARPQLISL
jgi:hypothetical protein